MTVEARRFPVEGMICSTCVGRISRTLGKLDGVHSVRVDLGHELVTVRRDPEMAPDAVIAAAIEAAGYRARIDDATTVDATPTFLERLFGH